jgi:hypothetical protein
LEDTTTTKKTQSHSKPAAGRMTTMNSCYWLTALDGSSISFLSDLQMSRCEKRKTKKALKIGLAVLPSAGPVEAHSNSNSWVGLFQKDHNTVFFKCSITECINLVREYIHSHFKKYLFYDEFIGSFKLSVFLLLCVFVPVIAFLKLRYNS